MPSPTRPSAARFWALYLVLATVITVVDLWTKSWAFDFLDVVEVVEEGHPPRIRSQRTVVVIPNFFELEATYNPGAFRGILGQHTEILALLSLVAVIVITVIVFVTLRRDPNPNGWFYAALGLIGGGTIGNLYDRHFLGAVRDWIKWFVVIDGQERVWPNFNIADAAICVGVAILILLEIARALRQRKEAKAAAANASS